MNILYAVLVIGALGAVYGLSFVLYNKVFAKDPAHNAGGEGANPACRGCSLAGCGGCAAFASESQDEKDEQK